MTNLGKYICNTCQKVYKTETGLSRHISQKHSPPSSSSEKTKYYQKLKRSKFDEIFKESADSLAKDKCYPEYIRNQFNNLYENVVVIYQKLTKNSNPEKFFSEFYGKIVLESEKYVGVKNPQSRLITSKIAEKLLHYFKVLQQSGEGSLSSSS